MRLLQVLFVVALMFCAMPERSAAQVATPCNIPAFPNPNVPTGQSALDPVSGQPEIFFNPMFFNSLGPMVGPPLFRYMLAHECSHHLNGDIIAQHLNPQGMLMINPQVELRADCGAAQFLKSQGDLAAIQVAIQYWGQFGNNPTGFNYPTGNDRAQTISRCAQ
jgi:hypothetical protein